MTVKVALVYPYFHPANDNSIFRFPPLGLGYLAAALKKHGFEVELVDCTFLQFQGSGRASGKRARAQIVGFYSMFSMKKTTLEIGGSDQEQMPEVTAACLWSVVQCHPGRLKVSLIRLMWLRWVRAKKPWLSLPTAFRRGCGFSNVKGLVFKR